MVGVVLWAPFGWAGLAGAVRWVTVGLGLMKAAAPCLFAGPGLVEAGIWAALGWAGFVGSAGWAFAGLGLVNAVLWAAFV